jgi:hypothetical protein
MNVIITVDRTTVNRLFFLAAPVAPGEIPVWSGRG